MCNISSSEIVRSSLKISSPVIVESIIFLISWKDDYKFFPLVIDDSVIFLLSVIVGASLIVLSSDWRLRYISDFCNSWLAIWSLTFSLQWLSTVRFLISIIVRLSLKIVLFPLSTVTLFIVDWVIFLCYVVVRWALNIFSSNCWLSEFPFSAIVGSSQKKKILQWLSIQYYFLFLW